MTKDTQYICWLSTKQIFSTNLFIHIDLPMSSICYKLSFVWEQLAKQACSFLIIPIICYCRTLKGFTGNSGKTPLLHMAAFSKHSVIVRYYNVLRTRLCAAASRAEAQWLSAHELFWQRTERIRHLKIVLGLWFYWIRLSKAHTFTHVELTNMCLL